MVIVEGSLENAAVSDVAEGEVVVETTTLEQVYHFVVIPLRASPLVFTLSTQEEVLKKVHEVVSQREYGAGTRGLLFLGQRIPLAIASTRKLTIGDQSVVVDNLDTWGEGAEVGYLIPPPALD